jgi:hypothetical protein
MWHIIKTSKNKTSKTQTKFYNLLNGSENWVLDQTNYSSLFAAEIA